MLNYIDHLIFTSPDLEEGMDFIKEKMGVRPILAGNHPKFGTRNALLSLGNETYFEVIAPDPDNQHNLPNSLFEDVYSLGPRLTTWVLRTESIEDLYRQALKHGVGIGEIAEGSRLNQDGSKVSWKASNPFAFPHDGAIPFLISWGNTPHPSTMLPKPGELLHLKLEHPEAKVVKNKLKILGIDMEVSWAKNMKFTAIIETSTGIVELS